MKKLNIQKIPGGFQLSIDDFILLLGFRSRIVGDPSLYDICYSPTTEDKYSQIFDNIFHNEITLLEKENDPGLFFRQNEETSLFRAEVAVTVEILQDKFSLTEKEKSHLQQQILLLSSSDI